MRKTRQVKPEEAGFQNELYLHHRNWLIQSTDKGYNLVVSREALLANCLPPVTLFTNFNLNVYEWEKCYYHELCRFFDIFGGNDEQENATDRQKQSCGGGNDLTLLSVSHGCRARDAIDRGEMIATTFVGKS